MIHPRRRQLLIPLIGALACHPDPSPRRSASQQPESVSSALDRATAAAPAAEPSATAPAAEREPEPYPPDASGLRGRTIDVAYDGKDVKGPGRAYTTRIFLHDEALRTRRPMPLVVFMHGLNRDLIPHRWMGGGNEGDVRRIVSELIDAGKIPPVILAGPGSIERAAVSGGSSFPVFDFDKLLDQIEQGAAPHASFDRKRVIVTGHSGAGCSDQGGIIAATRTREPVLAIVSIDTCMPGALATALGNATPSTHVIVTWQIAWDRPFTHFEKVFRKEVAAHPPNQGVQRERGSIGS